MLKLSSITKALTEAINAAPDVDSLSKTLGPCSVDPRIVQEYGTTHSATCVAYDPMQRLLAVGVDTGVKVLGADGLSVLLATRHHLEPAKIVRFARSVGRVVRVSVESGICVWDLKSQTLLASTRWQSEVTAIVGLRRSNFLMVGDADGVSAIATVRPGSPLGALVPHAYAVDTDQAIGVRAWERGVSSSSDDATHMHDSSCSGNPTAVGTSKSPVVAIEPQPGFETARVLLAFANNRLTLWDLHAKKCAAVNVAMNGSAGTEIGELRCATWVGRGGGVLATGHDAGVVCVWQVPAIGKPGSLRRNAAQITLSNVFHPQPGDNLHERMPVRGVVARAFGTAGGAMAGGVSGAHHKRSASGVQNESKGTAEENPAIGVLACVGGEEPGALDFAVLVPMAGDSNGKQEGPRGPSLPCAPRTSQAATLPYYGPVTSLALASPPFREETTAAIFTLSEGGQIHVHDARLVGGANYPVDAAHAPVPDDTRGVENSAYSVSAEVSTSDVTAVGSARNPLPVEEIGQAMPRLAARCAPAGTAASPGLLKSFATEIANAANARRALHETWGDAWPLTGGAPDDAGRWFKGSAAPRNVLAAAAADGGGVHVCVEGVGRFVPVALASPGPNAGMSPRDRAMTQCHLACGGAMLIIGRACGAVEVHVARALAAAGAGPENDRVTIRMLDGGLDLKQPVLDTTSRNSTAGYRLVGELGVHSSRVTCIETFIANDRSFLCVGDASGVVSVSDLKQGVLRFAASPFAGGAGDTEGVAAAAFCAPVVGTVSFELENEGVGFLDRSLSGSDARIENDCENTTPSPQTQNAFHGAEMLTLVSTGSALAFVSVASGEVLGKPCRPKTPSVALAVAPLDAFGASIRSARRGDRGTLRRLDHGLAPGSNWFWFTQDDPRSESAAGDTKHDHPTPPSHESLTALVAVASREALRVYPANGAIRGERHTLKKATASEPLIGAALVTPRGAEDTGTGDGDEGGAMTHRHASAFAAVTAHGRVLVWALPGLALLASVGKYFPFTTFRLPVCPYETDTFVFISQGRCRRCPARTRRASGWTAAVLFSRSGAAARRWRNSHWRCPPGVRKPDRKVASCFGTRTSRPPRTRRTKPRRSRRLTRARRSNRNTRRRFRIALFPTTQLMESKSMQLHPIQN